MSSGCLYICQSKGFNVRFIKDDSAVITGKTNFMIEIICPNQALCITKLFFIFGGRRLTMELSV